MATGASRTDALDQPAAHACLAAGAKAQPREDGPTSSRREARSIMPARRRADCAKLTVVEVPQGQARAPRVEVARADEGHAAKDEQRHAGGCLAQLARGNAAQAAAPSRFGRAPKALDAPAAYAPVGSSAGARRLSHLPPRNRDAQSRLHCPSPPSSRAGVSAARRWSGRLHDSPRGPFAHQWRSDAGASLPRVRGFPVIVPRGLGRAAGARGGCYP
eukprot:scaffold1318_cov388-Prasinococcus_capsulatus_cf.AAC.31